MIMRSGVVVVMVAVECFLKALGMIARGDIVMPLGQMK